MVAYADLILPDTTYLERHDCISLLDRPICEADAAADAIRWPVVEPDRDVRGFQSVLVDLGARLGLPGFVNDDGSAEIRRLRRLHRQPRTPPGHRPAGRFPLAKDGKPGAGRQPRPDRQLYRKRRFLVEHIPDEAHYYKPWNSAYQDWAVEWASMTARSPICSSSMSNRCANSNWPPKGTATVSRPNTCANGSKHDGPAADLVCAFEDDRSTDRIPVHALTQRPMAMYHSWGTQNAWLRQIHGHNPLYVPTRSGEQTA